MDIREAVKQWLAAKHVTLWADYDLTREDRFEAAVDWMTEEVQGVLDIVFEHMVANAVETLQALVAEFGDDS